MWHNRDFSTNSAKANNKTRNIYYEMKDTRKCDLKKPDAIAQ